MSNPKILSDVRIIQKCIIVRDDRMILALKRAADDHSRGGNWDLPGGGYEQGEEIIEAIKREVTEEAGLTAHAVTPVFVDNHMNMKEGFFAGLNVFGICYYTRDWEGDIHLSNEHTEHRWLMPEEFLTLDFGADNGFFVASMKSFIALPHSH